MTVDGATPISRLVAAGHGRARVVFGDGERVAAAELAEHGARLYSDTAGSGAVGVVMTNDRTTVEVVMGALLTGARVMSLPLPARGADLQEYGAFLRSLCASHELREVVVADELAGLLRGIGIPTRAHAERRAQPLAAPADRGFELMQFTSGSTRRPRPVALSDAEIGANVAAVLAVTRPRPGDSAVSWLPLAHDMGLVGILLSGLAACGPEWAGGGEIVLLDPRTFLRQPAVWVEALSHWRGAFTAAPDFAFRMAAARRPDGELDLSPLRCAIVGSEIVRAGTLAAFADAYEGCGFDPTALCPAYGLAELGVAATLTPPEVPWRELAVSSAGLARHLVRPPQPSSSGLEATSLVVASGPALPAFEVAVDASEDRVGQISVAGPSLGAEGTTRRPFAGPGGWYRTGDAGFVDRGWLYVCGRLDDWVVAHGRNIHAPTVEAAVGEVADVRPGRVTAVDLPTGGWVVVAEAATRTEPDAVRMAALRRRVRRAATDAAAARPDEVVIVAAGSLPLTSSGKLRRHEVRARLVGRELADVLAETAR